MKFMQQRVRVDLIFPRSGQVVPVFVPDTLVMLVAQRNLQVLSSLYGYDASSNHHDFTRRMHAYAC